MNNKPLSEKILIGIGVVVFLVFQIGIRVMNRQIKAESHPSAVQEVAGIQGNRYVELTVQTKANYGVQEFQSIHNGMTFHEVTQALHLNRLTKNLVDYIPNPDDLEALVVFKSPDRSRIEVVFNHDKVTSTHRFRN